MKNCFFLDSNEAALLVIDVQEKLFPLMSHKEETLEGLLTMIKGAKSLQLPIFLSEQNPDRLGPTIPPIKKLTNEAVSFKKTTFSCAGDPTFYREAKKRGIKQWILCGIEAHVCVLQTAKQLTLDGFSVTVINNAISSRSIYDFSTAIAEMKEWCRVTSAETALFEMIGDASKPEFKACLPLFKEPPNEGCCSCCS